MKNVLLILLFSLFLIGCAPLENTETPSNEPAEAATIMQDAVHTDSELGISFVIPQEWVVSTDESGELYMYRQAPYLTVGFRSYVDKDNWQKRIDDFHGPTNNDTLISSDQIDVDGYSTLRLIYDRMEKFQYALYFIEAENRWFEVTTADPSSAEITRIIKSLDISD